MSQPFAIARLAALSAACAACLWAGAASAQSASDIRQLNTRIDDLESQIQGLRADSYAGGGSSGGASGGAPAPAQVYLRLDRMEAELRRLTGELEQLGYRMTQLEEDQRKRFEDFEYRLLELEGVDPSQLQNSAPATGGASAPAPAAVGAAAGAATPAPAPGFPQSAPQGAAGGQQLAPGARVLGEIPAEGSPGVPSGALSGAPSAALATGTDEAAFQAALAKLQRGESDEADRAFRSFVVDYPASPRGGEARFWMGEIAYARSEYQQAARMYLDLQQNFPNDRKAPDALMKLGMSLARMGQNHEACLTLQEVPRQYPSAGPSVLRGAEIESRRLNCGY